MYITDVTPLLTNQPVPTAFPVMLYKSGTEIVWDGLSLDTMVADDDAAMADAMSSGWLAAADVASLNAPERAEAPKRPYVRKAVAADAAAA